MPALDCACFSALQGQKQHKAQGRQANSRKFFLLAQRAECGGFCLDRRWCGVGSSVAMADRPWRNLVVTARVLPTSVESEDIETLSFAGISSSKFSASFMTALTDVQGKQREEVYRESLESVARFQEEGGELFRLFTDARHLDDDAAACSSEEGADRKSGSALVALVQSIHVLPVEGDIEGLVKRSGVKLTKPDLNKILASLEGDDRVLQFFSWMRRTGRARFNSHAYSFVLRVLARNREWGTVDSYLQEIRSMGWKDELHAYNSLILAAGNASSTEQATRWFDRMLSKKVAPNEVTYGMLMIIYQKARKLTEARRVFAHMQACGPEACNAYTSMMILYMRAGRYDKAEQVVKDMTARNLSADRNNLIVRLNVFSQQGKVAECEKVMEKFHESNYFPGVVVYNSLIMAYGKARLFHKVMAVFQRFQESGLKADEVTYNSLVGACGKADKLKEAVQFYGEMKAMGLKPSRATFCTIVGLYGRAKNLGAASRMLIEMTEMGINPDAKILERVVKAFEACRKLNKVPRLLAVMADSGWSADVGCTAVMFSVFLKLKMSQKASEQFEVLRNAKMMPRESLCHSLLVCLRNAQQYEEVVKLFSLLQSEGISPGLDMCCTMIDVYGLLGKVSKAEELFDQIRLSTQKLDVVAYNVMLNVYMRAGLHQSASHVLKLMQEEGGFVPDAYTFYAMLRVFQKNGLQQEAADMYWTMQKARIKLDAALSNCVINCCGRALPLEETAAVFNNMVDAGFAPNAITCNVMIDIYGKQGHLEKASKVLKQAQEQGVADRISFSTLVNAYGKVRNFSKMEETLWEMQRSGFVPGLDTFNSMVDAYGKAGQFSNMEDVFERMKRAGCEQDLSTYNILLNVYGRQKLMQELQDVLERMREKGLKPDRYTYNTLIKTYGNAGQPDNAVYLFREMHDAGFMPDDISYSNLISAFEKSGNLLEAARWSLWMNQAGCCKKQRNP